MGQESDVEQRSLNFLDVDALFTSVYSYSADNYQHYHGEYVGNTHYDIDNSSVDNDEIIAHTLQEEQSHLTISEASEPSHAEEAPLHASMYSQDWLSPSTPIYYPGHEEEEQEPNDMGPSSSCSSPGKRFDDGAEYSTSLELADEYGIDGEVCKRLNHMISIPHVPRTNREIPSVDEATTDHQRLLDRVNRIFVATCCLIRLQLYDLVEHKVQGDGNCQFRALSDQFYRSPEHHEFVRRQIVDQLKAHPEIYEGYVPLEYGDYLMKMSKSGEWGDHVTLQAAADSYGIKICVVTSFKDTCFIEILPDAQKSKRGKISGQGFDVLVVVAPSFVVYLLHIVNAMRKKSSHTYIIISVDGSKVLQDFIKRLK
ncbi:OTU domain [Dillenia turbinata]|uniref:OTU domain n=1 Tax=Dillenia turbinata TaxID=194707 RepID=A0AAN8W9I2_9MAGN